jgi:putative tricarboxylic transport membrane protein
MIKSLSRSYALRAALLALVAGFVAIPHASAQWRPTRDVEFVIPFGLGGGADLLARVMIRVMTEERMVPTSVVAVNRPGGGSAVGMGYVTTQRRADAHTLVLINPQTAITPLRVRDTRGWRDVTPVVNLMLDDYLLLVRRESPYQDAAALVAAARTRPPRSVSIGSAGTADEMAIAVFEAAANIQLNVVRFNSGGEVLTALLGGHVDIASGNPLEFVAQMQANAVRGLGVFRPTRFPALPDIKTMAEQGIQTEPFQMWRGVAVPKDAPAEAVAYWRDVMRRVAASPAVRAYIRDNIAIEHVLEGPDYVAFLERQEALYRDMLQRMGGN